MADIDALLRQLDEPDTSDVDAMLKALDDARNPSGWTPWGSAGAGAAQGGTLNWADEILSQGPTAMIAGAAESLRTGEPVRDVTNRNTQMVDDTFAAAQEANPGAYQAGNIGGAVGVGLMSAPIAGGSNLGWTMARGAGIGATEGAVAGAGAGEGGRDRLAKGLGYGLVGAGLGGAAPAAIAGLSAGLRAGSDALAGVPNAITGRASNNRARKVIADLLQQSGQSGDDVTRSVGRAAAEGQPEFRVMDALGRPGQRKASGITRAGGPGAEEIANYLKGRQVDAPERFGRVVEEAYGFPAASKASGTDIVPEGYEFTESVGDVLGRRTRSAKQAVSDMTQARGQTADTLYDAARGSADAVDVRGAIQIIDDRIGPMQGSNIKGDGIDAKLSGFRSRLMASPAPEGEISRELSDFDRIMGVKQDVQDAIGAATRAGRNNEARELSKLVRELDRALEGASEGYRKANDTFRADSRVIDAVGQGRDMAGRTRAADTIPEFTAMDPTRQQAARIGYGDRVLEEIDANQAAAPNVARRFSSPNRRAEADAMTLDPSRFARQVGREDTMFETYNRALQGSRTADHIEDITRNAEMGPWVRAGQKALNLNLGDAAAEVGSAIAPYLRNENEATRALIAKALLSKDPEKVLMPAIKAGQASEARKRIAEALVRAGLREPAYGAIAP